MEGGKKTQFYTSTKINKQGSDLEQISNAIACLSGKDTSLSLLSLLSLEGGGKGEGVDSSEGSFPSLSSLERGKLCGVITKFFGDCALHFPFRGG